jgi:hypothetical protein
MKTMCVGVSVLVAVTITSQFANPEATNADLAAEVILPSTESRWVRIAFWGRLRRTGASSDEGGWAGDYVYLRNGLCIYKESANHAV